ncbi:MAG TPA: pyridoxamine 5'-phosphate oxidase family protein [Acidimicrobiales bacterium]|jgi:PPOX class probable F420-dependent enzyme|nr:pyridoxamine 5'-phosphate oxidase family protein [Acidimicrobiales bacterium]
MALSDAALRLLRSDALAHLVTINPDGSPLVSIVWVGLDGPADAPEIVAGHLFPSQRKVRNMVRDPRVALSIETDVINGIGLAECLVVYGRARIVEGGAPELLQHLAHTYLGPDVVFPPFPDPPPGVVLRISVDRIGGVGPWTA